MFIHTTLQVATDHHGDLLQQNIFVRQAVREGGVVWL